MPELADRERHRGEPTPAAVRRTSQPSERARSLDEALGGQSAEALLALQGSAGNAAVADWVQRAPVATATAAPTSGYQDYAQLLEGFTGLAVAAITEHGRTLDTVHIGVALSPAHRVLLEQIRRVLILAQESAPGSKETAIAEWPSLATRMQDALQHARQLGVPGEQVAVVEDNLWAVAERYVHAPHRGPAQAESVEDYSDLMTGVQALLGVVMKEEYDKRNPLTPPEERVRRSQDYDDQMNARQRQELQAVAFGPHLSTRHWELLVNLKAALVAARTEAPGQAGAALMIWQAVQGDFKHVFERADELLTGVPEVRKDFDLIGLQLIHGGVYLEAHYKAIKETNLRTPDAAFEEERLKEAAVGFKEVDDFAKEASVLAGRDVMAAVLSNEHVEGLPNHLKVEAELAKAIVEMVHSPGEIVEKYHEFQKKGIIGKGVTMLDIADKTLTVRNAIVEVSCVTLKRFAEGQAEVALKAGLQSSVERWSGIAEWAGGKLEMVEKVGKVAGVISIVVSAIKVVDYIRQGKWGEAFKEIGTTTVGLAAGAAGGLGGTAVMGGAAVVIAAELEGLHGAAEMLRYCHKESTREAAMTFVDECQSATGFAKDLVADARIIDKLSPEERAIADENLWSYAKYWLVHVERLSEQLNDTRSVRLGGQPGLREALGSPAIAILQNPGDWAGTWESMAEQVRVVFAGANNMARWAVENYPRSEKKEEAEGEKE